jgi:hypothetical protein
MIWNVMHQVVCVNMGQTEDRGPKSYFTNFPQIMVDGCLSS